MLRYKTLLKTTTPLLLAVLLFSGCDFLKNLQSRWQKSGEPTTVADEAAERSLGFDRVRILTPKEKQVLHLAFITELYHQAYARPLIDKKAQAAWINVLSQGASIEGVYRGLVQNSEYEALEQGIAAEAARQFFVKEMVRIRGLLEAWAAKTPEERTKLEQTYEAELSAKVAAIPLFTLKRLLGDRWLSLMAVLGKQSRPKLEEVVAQAASEWAALGIDLGYAERNHKDVAKHLSFAEQSSLGRIQWEVLVKIHRIMNSLGGILVAPIAKPEKK